MSNRLRARLLLSPLLLGLGLSSCFCGPPPLPDRPDHCDAEGVGCLPDEACVEGKCVKFDPCTSDADCPSPAYRCTFPAQLCEIRPGFDLECASNFDCDPGTYCALGRCRVTAEARTCATRGDCPQGEHCSKIHFFCIEEAPCTLIDTYPELACDPDEMCDPISGRCVLECQNQCTVETEVEDCPTGTRCDAACRCVQCITDMDCGEGLICNVRAGRCESENICYGPEDCEEPLICDPATALCQVPPPPCQDDLDCNIAEICNRATGVCELPGGACFDDRFEDADTPAQAEEIVLPLDGVEVLIDELQLCPDDDDVYAITLEPGDEVVATIQGTTPLAQATVWMLDNEGETNVGFAQAPPYGNGTIQYKAQDMETVFLRVNALTGPTPYEMVLTRNPGEPCAADVWEGETGNDTEETATPPTNFPLDLNLNGTICPGDVDRFAVELMPGEGVDVELNFDDAALDFDMRVYDTLTDDVLIQSASISSPETLRYRTQTARTVHVEITGFANSAGDYTVRFSHLEPFECLADAQENDDNPTDAVVLTGTETVDELGLTLCTGDDDLFRVPLLDFERVVARATFSPADLDIVIDVLDATGENVLSTSPNAGGAETVTYNADGDEEVLVRFRGLLNTQGPYAVSIFRENQVVCAPDLLEPNDTVEQAIPAPTFPVSLTVCDSDNDIFAVEASAGKRLNAKAAFLHSDGDIDLQILGLDGVQILASSDGIENHEEVEAELPLDGIYFLRVFSLSDGARARYDLEVSFVN